MHLRCILLCLVQLVSLITCNVIDKKPSVVIIGAGVSGISAAAKLLENEITDITILEAEDRIGGRINSVRFGDAVIDLGAEWVHGRNNNVVYEMVKDLGVVETSDYFFELYESGARSYENDFKNELWEIFLEYMDTEGVGMSDSNETVGYAFQESYQEKIVKKWGDDPKKLMDAKKAFTMFEKCLLSSNSAFDLNDVSVASDYVECEGAHSNWKGIGYRTLLDIIMKKYPNPKDVLPLMDKVLLNTEVRHIDWSNSENVSVECSDGSSYQADYVIFTPSLGVLKENYKTMFTPQLPEVKQNAIKYLGFGAVAKVVLKFPTAWWTKGRGFGFVWSDEDRINTRTEFPKAITKDGSSWLESSLGFFVAPNNSKVLSGWFVGPSAKVIEQENLEDLREGTMFLINKFISSQDKGPRIPQPEEIIRTTWYKNKHFRGTYSYESVDSRIHGVTNGDLSKPMGRLRFAGEATHPHFYSTVHGAYETGRREADRIIKDYTDAKIIK